MYTLESIQNLPGTTGLQCDSQCAPLWAPKTQSPTCSSENPVLFSMTVVWDMWQWGLQRHQEVIPASHTTMNLLLASPPFFPQDCLETNIQCQSKEGAKREGGFPPEQAPCAGTNYSLFQRSWEAGATQPLLEGGGWGPCRGWDGGWLHLIRSEEWLMIHKRSLPTEVDKLPVSLQQSWRTYLVRKFSLNQRFYGFYFVALEKGNN